MGSTHVLRSLAWTRWVNPTGGLLWHARAWRNLNAWQPTLHIMQDWWLQNAPRADRLVIIGASAGWMMSPLWLRQFKAVQTWDIDPWSHGLFQQRHGRAMRQAGTAWTHHLGDAWSEDLVWKQADDQTLYWFDNVLGQLRFMGDHATAQARILEVRQRLHKTRWGSVHDRYSGALSGHRPLPPAWRSSAGVDLASKSAQDWLQSWGAQGHWLDHLTEQVFENGTPVLNLAWAFKPRFGHWLEMGWQLP